MGFLSKIFNSFNRSNSPIKGPSVPRPVEPTEVFRDYSACHEFLCKEFHMVEPVSLGRGDSFSSESNSVLAELFDGSRRHSEIILSLMNVSIEMAVASGMGVSPSFAFFKLPQAPHAIRFGGEVFDLGSPTSNGLCYTLIPVNRGYLRQNRYFPPTLHRFSEGDDSGWLAVAAFGSIR